MRLVLAVLALLATVFAGCVDSDEVAPPELLAMPPPGYFAGLSALPAFSWALTGCNEAGGVSVYDRGYYANPLPDPFVPADISKDAGRPYVSSLPSVVPVTTNAIAGHWHMVVRCASGSVTAQGEVHEDGEATHDGHPGAALVSIDSAAYGWVAAKVRQPPWDTSNVTDHYLLADWSMESSALASLVGGLTAVHATTANQIVLDQAANNVYHPLLDDPEAGVYEMVYSARPMTESPWTTARYWLLAPIGEQAHNHNPREHTQAAGYQPVGFEIVDSASKTHHVSPDSTSTFTHTGTTHHGPQGAAAGNVVGVAYADFDRTIQLVAMPDVTLSRTWFH